jgi:hypothetical protein
MPLGRIVSSPVPVGKGLAGLLGEVGVGKTCRGMRLRREKISPHGPSPTMGEGAISEAKVSYEGPNCQISAERHGWSRDLS